MSGFHRGESILFREIDEHCRIIDVKPVTVIEDSEDTVVVWLPLGTPTKRGELLTHTPGTPRRWKDGVLVDAVWRWAELLIVVYPDQLRATHVKWSSDRVFQGWYVNMQSKLNRTRLGFDFRDHQLDIVVEPDGAWRWKDENELELAVEDGRIEPVHARAIRAEGRRAVAEIERKGSPFSDGWEHWHPDPMLPHPELTPDWDDLSMY